MKQQTIQELQENPDYVILRNPLASPKFIRTMGTKAGTSIEATDIYTPKLFYEIASRLTPEHLANIKINESVILNLNIKQFLESIGANIKNYKYLIDSVKSLKNCGLEWRDSQEQVETGTNVITKYKHFEKEGKIHLFIDSEVVQKILEVKIEDGNFSFLKANAHRLQNAQALRLYPFFKSWMNYGRYDISLERFKEKFGYNTSGYRFWNNFEERVLKPAMEEINEKTDIFVSYEPTGENLDGKRPRIDGLKFVIHKKEDIKLLPTESPTPGVAHIDTANQPGLFDKQDQISQIYELMNKIQIGEKPPEATARALIENLINEIGYQQTRDGMIGMLDTKAKPKTISFFTKANLLKYPGYEKTKEEVEEKKRTKKEEEQEKIKKQRFAEEIKKAYETAKEQFYKKEYAELDSATKDELIQELWDSSTSKMVYFRNGDKKQPNNFAVYQIAENYIFPGGYDRQKHMKQYVLKNFNIQIDFDQAGETVIIKMPENVISPKG